MHITLFASPVNPNNPHINRNSVYTNPNQTPKTVNCKHESSVFSVTKTKTSSTKIN